MQPATQKVPKLHEISSCSNAENSKIISQDFKLLLTNKVPTTSLLISEDCQYPAMTPPPPFVSSLQDLKFPGTFSPNTPIKLFHRIRSSWQCKFPLSSISLKYKGSPTLPSYHFTGFQVADKAKGTQYSQTCSLTGFFSFIGIMHKASRLPCLSFN